jgi:hypothetical protein
LKLRNFPHVGQAGHGLVEGQSFDGFQVSRDTFDWTRKAPGQKVDQQKLCDRQPDNDDNDLPVRGFELPDEVVSRREYDSLPWEPEAFREPGKGCTQLLSIPTGSKQELVLVCLRPQSIRLARILIVNVFQPRDFESANHHPNTLLLLGSRNDPAVR